MESEPEQGPVDPESERPPILPDLPRRPERPPRPAAPAQVKQPANALVTIGSALVGLLLLSAILLICTGGNPVVLIASGGIFAFAALHYIVWGWWLGRMIHDEETARDDESDS